MTEIQETLFSLRDEGYCKFQRKLIPNLDPERIIGVRTPELRKLAKQLDPGFRHSLPHRFFEENQLHIFSLEQISDFDTAVQEVDTFLPYVDNWATCDQMIPKVFKEHHAQLLPYIGRWIESDHPYVIRFAVKMLMDHFLDSDFHPDYPRMVASVEHEEYYVRMMAAWYFATALATQYEAVLPYITGYRLSKWIHNKTIQKAVESYRITPEQKVFLKQYRIK